MLQARASRLACRLPRVATASFHQTAPVYVKVGDRIPNLDALVENSPGNRVNLSEELTGKGLIIGVPAAFSTLIYLIAHARGLAFFRVSILVPLPWQFVPFKSTIQTATLIIYDFSCRPVRHIPSHRDFELMSTTAHFSSLDAVLIITSSAFRLALRAFGLLIEILRSIMLCGPHPRIYQERQIEFRRSGLCCRCQ